MKKVLLAGEGRGELGGWFDEPHRRPESPQRGVLEALARRVAPTAWKVSDGRPWRTIQLYRAGAFRGREARRILRLALDAKEHGFDAVIFSRDSDTGPDAEDRGEDVRKGLREVATLVEGAPPMAGGVATPCLEGWVAAMLGVRGTESMSKPAADARELADFLQQVRQVLPSD